VDLTGVNVGGAFEGTLNLVLDFGGRDARLDAD
jgi:hypothetical protein